MTSALLRGFGVDQKHDFRGSCMNFNLYLGGMRVLRREERSKVLTVLRTSFMDGPSSNKACSCCWFPVLVAIYRGVKEYKVGNFSFLCCFEQKARSLGSVFGRRSHLSEGLSFFPSKRDPRESSGGEALAAWRGRKFRKARHPTSKHSI